METDTIYNMDCLQFMEQTDIKADVSVNIWCHLEAQRTGKTVQAFCAIGDTEVTVYVGDHFPTHNSIVPSRIPYARIVETARDYIRSVGGFESFAEWGLV